jgi:hypothetical protein
MSEKRDSGLYQFTADKAKTFQTNSLEKELDTLDASNYGFRTESYNSNNVSAGKFHKKLEKDEEEKELTDKEQVDIDKKLDLERAHLLNNAKEIKGFRIYDKVDKIDSKKMFNEHEDVTISGMGRALWNGTGIYRGGFSRYEYQNSILNKKAKDAK